MLVLSRKIGEQIVLPECNVTISVLAISGKRVRIGVAAPPETAVHRKETLSRPRHDGNSHPSSASPADLNGRLVRWIADRTGGRIRSLRVEHVAGRVVVRGSTRTYYARQLAYAAAVELLNATGAGSSGEVEMDIEVVADPSPPAPAAG